MTTSVLYSTLPAQFFKRLSCPRTMNGRTNGAATAATDNRRNSRLCMWSPRLALS